MSLDKIWYFLVIFPILVLIEGHDMFAGYLKKKKIYAYWDVWHSVLVIFIVLAVVAMLVGW